MSMNNLTEGQKETMKQVVNEYIDRKITMMDEDDRFFERFNSKRVAENIECELVNKRSHMFKISNDMTVTDITNECERVLIEEIKERNI